MADVTVEFGAKDAGLSQTLKNVQKELAELDSQQRSAAMSADEFQKSLSRTKQLEGMEKKLRSMSGAMQDVGEKTDGVGKTFDFSFAKMTAAFSAGNIAAAGFNKAVEIAFSAARSVAQGFGDALDLGGRLTDLSARTGEAAGKLLVLETAFKNSGLGAEMVGTVINKLQNFMQDAANGGDKQAAAMTDLGISLEELKGKTPTEQMKIFADNIAAIKDPTQRAAMASEVFGEKLGGKLLPLLVSFSPALDDARGKVGSMEKVMDENAATFDAAGETIDAVKGKLTAFAAGILGEVIPAVDGLGASMENVDAAGLGESVGKSVTPLIQGLTNATRGAIAALADISNANTKAANDTGILGSVYRGVTTSLDGFNQMMADAFTYYTPFGFAMSYLVKRGEDLSASQKNVATSVETATETIGELGGKATETGDAIGSSFSLTSDFNTTIDGLSSGWSDFNSEVSGTAPLLESSYSYADSIAGKIDEQVAGIGNYNKQLDLSKSLEEQIKNIKTERAEKEKESAAKESERQTDLRTNLQLDLEILKAQISGNEQEERAVQYKKDYNAALKQAIDAGMGQPEAKSFADEIARARQEQAGMNKELSASAKLLQNIAQAEAKGASKISGLEQRGQKQIEKGQFQAARRTAEQIQRSEIESSIRGEGKGRDTRSMYDIGKSFGLRQQKDETSSEFAKRVKDVKEGKAEVSDKFGRSKPLPEKPGEDGKKKEEDKNKKNTLESLVMEIKNLVAKIEPKLPQQALAY